MSTASADAPSGSRAILEQAGWLAASKIVQGGASILATLAVARSLGPEAFGLLSLAIAIASFVATGSALGLENIAVRELSAATDARRAAVLRMLRRTRLAGAVLGFGVLIGMSAIPAIRGYGIAALLLVLSLLPLAQVGDLAEWRLVAAGRSRAVAVVALLCSPAAAIARVVLAFAGASVGALAWMLLAEWSVRSLLLWIAARESTTQGAAERESLSMALSMLRDAMPLLMSGIAIFIYMRIDQFMIAAMRGPDQVGLYSATVALSEVPLVLPVLLLRASLPTLTRQSETDPRLRDQTLTRLMRSGFYLHLAVAVVIAAIAEPLMSTLYGEAFRAASTALRIQVLAAPFVALGVLSSAWLVLEHRTGHSLRRTLVGAIVNVVLNLALIPRYGIAGAATATVIAQAIAAYAADALDESTRALLMLKTRAVLLVRT